MTTLLVKNAHVVTMDEDRNELADGGLFARDGWIETVAPSAQLPDTADEVLDLSGQLLIPGLINTHHHLYQTLTRAVPSAQNAVLFPWLQSLYPIWARLGPEEIRVSTQVGMAELALSGCTTVLDHLYLFPNGSRLDDEIEAAQATGMRLHASRGSMSLGEADGGLPPDSVVEEEEAILEDCARVIEAFHDPRPGSMVQIVVAPCSPFSVTEELMRRSAELARHYGVLLHTHLAETRDEERFCLERFGKRPVDYAADLGWEGDDVWFAHAVHISETEISRMGSAGTGVAHCPTSNMRLGSGISPILGFLDAGVRVGIGVDGSASNDGSHLLAEARQAMLMARLAAGLENRADELLSARRVLEMATRGGAQLLGRTDIGNLAAGMACDFAALDLRRIEFAGAVHDPVAAALLAAPVRVSHNWVHGQAVVTEGQLVNFDEGELTDAQNRAARALLS